MNLFKEVVWRMTTSWEKQQLRSGRKYDRMDTVLHITAGAIFVVGLFFVTAWTLSLVH
jgi:hypothetical protein